MDSFKNIRALVIGAGGGIGQALVEQLAGTANVERLFAASRRNPAGDGDRFSYLALDLEEEDSIARAAASCRDQGGVNLVIVATGLLHQGSRLQPEKSWRALDPEQLMRSFAVNTIGPALVAKHFLPLLPRGERSVFAALSARVGSISDNRLGGWHGYRASKAALNMMIRNLAIELARRNPSALCIGLHPGTVDTPLSSPFQGNVPPGKLFSPGRAARQLLTVIDQATAENNGQLLAWDGQVITP